MASASKKVRERIKKLIALATSNPEPEEAATAQAEADRLMVYHGLTPADFTDDVLEIADEQRDDLRQRLATAISISRRVRILGHKNGQLAFFGHPSAAANAREAYQTLVADVSEHCEIASHDPGRDTWRWWFWKGFVDVVIERLVDDEARAWIPVGGERKKADVEPVVPFEVAVGQAMADFGSRFEPDHRERAVRTLTAEAYEAGRRHGAGAHIEPKERMQARRALGEWPS